MCYVLRYHMKVRPLLMEQDIKTSPVLREAVVEGIRAAGPMGEAVMVLKEKDGERRLSVWIGVLEAYAISLALERVPFPRPLTHDLFLMALARLEARITGVSITGLALNTFFASIDMEQNGKKGSLDARPSDAVALALRAGIPIRVAEDLLTHDDTSERP